MLNFLATYLDGGKFIFTQLRHCTKIAIGYTISIYIMTSGRNPRRSLRKYVAAARPQIESLRNI